MDEQITVERTGNIFSFAASEYLVTFPNGDKTRIWSPPWHEMKKNEEDISALEFAKKIWEDKSYTPIQGEPTLP